MKKKIKVYLASFMILCGIACSAPVMADTPQEPKQVQETVTTPAKLPTRMPTSKKALAYKFIMAMLGVGASSVIIYVLLSIYNRFIYGTPRGLQDKSEDDEFKTPTNMKDAINIFLKKTK